MEVGRVTGSVWCTRKTDRLEGVKLLVAERWDLMKNAPAGGVFLVCADLIGAGVGERVLLATGGAARRALGDPEAPVDAAVVGILDGWETHA